MLLNRRLRFAVACAGTTLPAWQVRCLDSLLATDAQLVGLLVDRSPGQGELGGLAHRSASVLWRGFLRLFVAGRGEGQPVDSSRVLGGVPVLGQVDQVADLDLDFILRLDGASPSEAEGRRARYGSWSFHHGRQAGALSPCFWEISHGRPLVSVTLRRSETDGSESVLREGHLPTLSHSYRRTLDGALRGSADWPAHVCARIASGWAPPPAGPRSSPVASHDRRDPGTRETATFLLRLVAHFVRHQAKSLFRADHWTVGLMEGPIHRVIEPGPTAPIRWLPELPRGRYLADPFGRVEGGEATLLAEEFDYATGTGRICSVHWTPLGGSSAPRGVMDINGHASYPFVFAHEGEWYCTPETHEAREVALYRAAGIAGPWQRIACLVDGFAALDPTVFEHDGRWWLLCTDHDCGPNSHLHAFFADDLLGPWTSHPANPVKVDVRSARPAGTPFVHDGQLYRPAQDSSATYGGAVVVNRVVSLTPTDFSEEVVKVIDPASQDPSVEGIHTLSAAGEATLVDGKRSRFVLAATRRAVRDRLRRRLS